MSDQAQRLRDLVRPAARAAVRQAARTLVLAGGKGGVGTSHISLNLAVALGQLGQSVTVLDADLGGASLDLVAGVYPSRDLGDVLDQGGSLADARVDVAPRQGLAVRLVPGAHGIRTAAGTLEDAPALIGAELEELRGEGGFVLVDAGTLQAFTPDPPAAAAATLVIVTTPEPSALAGSQALLARLRRRQPAGEGALDLCVLINQAGSRAEAADALARFCAASREFLGVAVRPLGWIALDDHVRRAAKCRRPLQTEYPRCAAARQIRALAQRLIDEQTPEPAGKDRLRGAWQRARRRLATLS
jgi:flagellar biosynthesis protein FlhG